MFFCSNDSLFLLFPFCSEQMKDGWNFVSTNYHMTWSAFALFLACRTEFAFNIGHFLIILPFHSLLATFQVSISLIFYLSWSQCFGWNTSEVVRRSKLRNTFMHRPSFFSFHFLSFLTSFPKLTIFYYFTSLHGLQEVDHHCAYLKEISSCSLVEKFHISAFPMYYSCLLYTSDAADE